MNATNPLTKLSTLLALLPLAAIAVSACGARTGIIGSDEGPIAVTTNPNPNPNGPSNVPDGGRCAIAFTDGSPGESVNGVTRMPRDPQEFMRVTGDSTFTISDAEFGRMTSNAEPGLWHITSPEGQNEGAIPTGRDGTYNTQVPLFCGPQTVQFVWCNERSSHGLSFLVERVNCTVGGLHATLSWGAGATDFELHVIKQGGRINDNATDCTWTSCIGAGPDWGLPGVVEDNPRKDLDATGENGIENIEVPRIDPIFYDVLVEYWGSGAPSTATMVLNVGGKTTRATSPVMRPRDVWWVARVDGRAGTVTPQGRVTDCSADWSGGCTLPIP